MPMLFALGAVIVLGGLAALLGQAQGLQILFTAVLPYSVLALFVGGVLVKVAGWARSPVPFRIPTTCGQQKSLPWIKSNNLENPYNIVGVVGRMALEVFLFRSLFRNTKTELHRDGPTVSYGPTKWLWLGGLVFHYSMLVIVIRHLRLFTEPVPVWILWLQQLDGFFEVGVPAMFITTVAFLVAVSYLFLRRVFIPQLRYISLANDYFPLFLLLGIGATGAILRHFVKTDIVGVKELILGVVTFSPVAMPGVHWWFYVHFMLVLTLFAYFPFSKLMHAGGVWMSPTRNLANNNRVVRHINPWNPTVKVHTYEEYEDDFRQRMVDAGLPVDKPLEQKGAEGAQP
ncbi:MAG: sulfate reduction electron transfer complex DsrMKJOP subunit DsrM [Pseudomonadota bacterium]